MSLCDIPSPLAASPGLPISGEGDPVFAEPWQAQAFAMTVHLHQQGLFSWPEWAETLSAELHKPGRAEDGSDYFDGWVAALTSVLVRKGVADERLVLALQESWQRAAAATPHGVAIERANDPLA